MKKEENGKCTPRKPCTVMQMAIDEEDAKKRGGVCLPLGLRGQFVAVQSAKRGSSMMLFRLCPWCGEDVSEPNKWGVGRG